MRTLGKNIKIAVETAPGEMMDVSGMVKDLEVSAGIGGQIETNLTLIGQDAPRTVLGADEVWNIPFQPEPKTNDNIADQIRAVMEELYPQEVIVECRSCRQWGAIKTQCKYCGGPV